MADFLVHSKQKYKIKSKITFSLFTTSRRRMDIPYLQKITSMIRVIKWPIEIFDWFKGTFDMETPLGPLAILAL